jgi:hypothetical protein
MVTMVIVASAALMLTMFLMRRTAAARKRDRGDRIRWRGIDWSRGKEEPEEDRFKDSD